MNARSIVNKTDKLEELLFSYTPDIVVITETWLHPDILDFEIVPSSYCLLRSDRDGRGGGVAIAIKRGLQYRREKGIANHESVWCTIFAHDAPVLIGGIYRKPNASDDYVLQIHDYLVDKVTPRTKLILTGDFNLAIDWENLTSTRNTANSELLYDLMFNFSLSQLVQEPTRIQGNTRSILDLAFLSDKLSGKATVEDGISDHKMLIITFNLECLNTKPDGTNSRIAVKDYTRANDVCVIDYLDTALETFSLEECEGVNGMWIQLKKIITYCEQNFIPTILKRTQIKTPWINRRIIHLKRRVQRMRKKKRNPIILKELASQLKAEIGNARQTFFSHTLSRFMTDQPQKFWRFLARPENPTTEVEIEGTIVKDAQAVSNAFNRYFQSVFTRACAPSSPVAPVHPFLMPDVVVTTEGILNLLLQIDVKKSVGPDNISNVFLRRYAEQLCPFLEAIFKASLLTASLPADWLCAKVIPIHKGGSKLSIETFRPISLTSCCCKLLEHVINKAIITYLEDNNLLHPNQHGFRKNLSTVTQLLEITHDFVTTINSQLQTDSIFIDFVKTFDKVPRSR